MHRLDIVVEMRAALAEIGQVSVGQVDHLPFHVLPGELDEVGRDRVADAPAARVQHHPHLAPFVQTDLDEVIPSAERAHLVRPPRELAEGLEQLRVAIGQGLETGLEGAHRIDQHTTVGMLVTADGHIARDLIKDLLQPLLVDVICRKRKTRRNHAAADIDAHRRRDDRLVGGDHRADGRADAQMHVGHGGDVVVDEGQAGEVGELRLRALVDVVGPDPDRHGAAFQDGLYRHG